MLDHTLYTCIQRPMAFAKLSIIKNFFDIESIFLSVFYYKDKEKYRYIKI